MGVLGELWVKLGLKNEEFKKGIDEAQGKTKTFGEDVKKVSGKVKAAWAAVGAAVIKLGTDMVKQTQVIGDKWGVFTAGLSAAYEDFVSRIGSGKGWDNLIANMLEANRVGREVAAMRDELFEMNSSISIKEAEYGAQIAKNEKIIRDTTRSNEERVAAAEANLALEKEILEYKKKSANQELQAAIKLHTQKTSMSEAERKFFVEDYIINQEAIQAVNEKMTALEGLDKKEKELRRSWLMSDMEWQEYQEQSKELSRLKNEQLAKEIENYDWIAAGIKKLNLGNDAIHTAYTKAKVQEAQAEEQYERRTLRSSVALARFNEEIRENIKLTTTSANTPTATPAPAFQRSVTIGGVVPTLNVEKPEINLPPLDFEAVDQMGVMVDEWEKQTERASQVADIFNEAVAGSIVNSLNSITDAIANGESLSFGQVVSNLLTPLADAAISAGMLMLSTGTGIEALKDSLMSLNGTAAIAAGAALVAVGTAAKIGLASIGKNMGNANPSYTYSGGGYGVNMTSQSAVQQVEVTGVIKGQDIYLASEKYQQSRRR